MLFYDIDKLKIHLLSSEVCTLEFLFERAQDPYNENSFSSIIM